VNNHSEEELYEITWNTVVTYLNEKHETPVPMCGSNSCVLVINPKVNVELQLRTDDAFQTNLNLLPQLTRLHYENVKTKNYKYLSVVCDYSDFDQIVLKYLNSISFYFIIKKTSADLAILNAYKQWKNLLAQPRMLDEKKLIGIWGELFIIDRLLMDSSIDATSLIQNWSGPLGMANDFSFGKSCIEVKATTKQSNIVEISSIDQLDAKDAWILLLHVLYAPINSGGITISDLVNKIQSTLGSIALEIFQKRIEEMFPFSDLSQLNYFTLKIDDIPIAIRIDNSFPLLTRTRISQMLSCCSLSMLTNVKYTLNLADKLSTGSSDIYTLFKELIHASESHE
jgi:hypothetical protein